MKSKLITIEFVMKKGEGDMPTKLSKSEKKNIGSICTFYLDWDDGQEPALDSSIIDKCEVFCENNAGIELTKTGIEGTANLIIKFHLNKKVNTDAFKRMVWMSSINIRSAKQNKDGESGYYREDSNGYTSVVSNDGDYGTSKEFLFDQLRGGITVDKLQN